MISVGRIVKSVGVKGQVYVEPFSGRNDRLTHLQSIFIGASESDARRCAVESVEARRDGTVLKLRDVNGRSEAEALRGMFLFVEDEKSISLKHGTFFVHEIIGLTAVGEDGGEIGKISDVLSLPAGDVWVLKMGTREMMIPAVKEFVRRVDVPSGKVVIHVIDGLLE